MKLFILLFLLSFGAFADVHERLDSLIAGINSASNETQIEQVLAQEYYDIDLTKSTPADGIPLHAGSLSGIFFSEIENDENGVSTTEKVIQAGELIADKFPESTNSVILDFMQYEYSCADGGSC